MSVNTEPATIAGGFLERQEWLMTAYRSMLVPPSARHIGLALNEYVDPSGGGCTSHAILADDTGMSNSTVRRSIDKLVRCGLLTVETSGKDAGAPNHYRFTGPTTDWQYLGKTNSDRKNGYAGAHPSKQLRQDVISIFQSQCQHCQRFGDGNKDPDGHSWHMDRIVPGARGGMYTIDNVSLACRSCNLRRGVTPFFMFMTKVRTDQDS